MSVVQKQLMQFLTVLTIVFCVPLIIFAQEPSSDNFKFEETTIGNGGTIDAASPNFQSAISVGDTAVGNSESGNFQIDSGSQTTDDPALSFIVDTAIVDFGSFTASGATTATSTFSVINYTSYGYIVHIIGDTPTNGSHTIPAMETTGPSIAGLEQFGINLVANTSPASVGANPVLGDFGAGAATANYDTPNQYRFVSGEAIAQGTESSGEVNYTISYLVNVDSLTPGGKYVSSHTLICTGTY